VFGREAFAYRIEQLEREVHTAKEVAEQWRACYYEEKNRADRFISEALELAKMKPVAVEPTISTVEKKWTAPAPEVTVEDAQTSDTVEAHFTEEIQRAIALRADDFNAVRELTEWAERQRMAGASPDDIAFTIEHGLMVEPDDDGHYEEDMA
jgi:hypothetical protein